METKASEYAFPPGFDYELPELEMSHAQSLRDLELQQQQSKLFVGGLAHDTTTESLRIYFGQYGRLQKAEVIRDHRTQRSRGFGFVIYQQPAVAEQVYLMSQLSLSGHVVDGKVVEIKFAVPRSFGNVNISQNYLDAQATYEGKAEHPRTLLRSNSLTFSVPQTSEVRYLDGHRRDRRVKSTLSDQQGHQKTVAESRKVLSYDQQFSRRQLLPTNDATELNLERKIFVGGLAHETGHDSLRGFFQQFGEIELAEVMYNKNSKKSRGFGFVLFDSAETVQKVFEIQRFRQFILDGKEIEAKVCKAKAEAKAESKANKNQVTLQNNYWHEEESISTAASPLSLLNRTSSIYDPWHIPNQDASRDIDFLEDYPTDFERQNSIDFLTEYINSDPSDVFEIQVQPTKGKKSLSNYWA